MIIYSKVLTFFIISLIFILPKSFAADSWYVALGRCGNGGEGIYVSKVNVLDTKPVCLSPAVASTRADAATILAIPDIGHVRGEQLIQIESNLPNDFKAAVVQIFQLIAPPRNPLEIPVDRLTFFQGSALNCTKKAIFSFASLNSKKLQVGKGERDVRVNPVYDLPQGKTIEDLRHEILYEEASFRGMIERPTFDILHPFQERPLLITVFEFLPKIRTNDRCPR